MESWLIILGSALAGGLLVLHGFSKAKQVSDLHLNAYRDLLNQGRQQRQGSRSPRPQQRERPP